MPDFLLYKLTWNAAKQKFDKRPCRIDGSALNEGESPPRVDRATAAAGVRPGYALGMWIDPPMFFIDLDECVVDGKLNAVASALAAPFVAAGCYFESSVSGTGAHVIGTYTGELPAHCNRRPTAHKYEFYARERGVVLNAAASQGSMSVDATALLPPMLAEFFPARAELLDHATDERRPEWRGPEDDDELIRRALAARGSARQVFGGAWTFDDLWNGRVPENSRSEADLAMASHLAFWTGCDVPRIERIMRRSGLMRDKWNEHRTYLRDKTIIHACATTRNVYQEPLRVEVLPTPVLTQSTSSEVEDYYALVDRLIGSINNSGTFRELNETIMPTIGGYRLPDAHAQRVVQALSKRLKLFDSNMTIGAIRQIVTPPVMHDMSTTAPPTWFAPFCYVRRTETYYNTLSGTHFTTDNFRTEYSRYMPAKQNGTRECPVQWARERWNVVTVDDTLYRPDQDVFFDHGGKHFANEYLSSSLPTIAAPSDDCTAAIQAFQRHLYLICNHRDDIYTTLLQWIAHNVQRPGHKIRWSPIIKGVPGDGKSIVSDVMRAALGLRNVKMTSISSLSNSGGFTDWATGAAVNFIEEIQLTGKERYKLFNSMKTYIADNYIDLNRKGRAAGDPVYNVTNHWANTNYGDALPIDDGDRRWCVVFTPYNDIGEAVAAKGFASVDDLVRHFEWLGAAMRREPGAWRGWLLGLDTSAFNPNARAPVTVEKTSMKLMSEDALDQAVIDVLERGSHGVHKDAFSSKNVMGAVELALSERPATRTWNTLLSRLGYQQHDKMVWWMGTSHRIWTKKPLTIDKIKEILDLTLPPTSKPIN